MVYVSIYYRFKIIDSCHFKEQVGCHNYYNDQPIEKRYVTNSLGHRGGGLRYRGL